MKLRGDSHPADGGPSRRSAFLLLTAWALTAFPFAGTAEGQAADPFPPGSAGREVLDYLLEDWSQPFTVTSVDIAMEAAGAAAGGAELRFRIGDYIRNHPELHSVIRVWGWETLALTPDEKLLARAIVNARRAGAPSPSVADLAAAVGITEGAVESGLAMLTRYGILDRQADGPAAGYVPADRYLNWEPRLDFLFHTVTLDSGRIFNTN